MRNIKLNSFASMFLVFSFLIIAIIFVKDDRISTYEHITIEQGDTLWSLAAQYRGKMAEHDWIIAVKKENALRDEIIISGELLLVPIVKNSKYHMEQANATDIHTIKLASEKNGSK